MEGGLLSHPQSSDEARLAALYAAIARGLADAEAGRVKPVGQVLDRLEKRYRSQARAKGR
jgi:antitoxin ParD1/3/4